jgi:hypothetical protein
MIWDTIIVVFFIKPLQNPAIAEFKEESESGLINPG